MSAVLVLGSNSFSGASFCRFLLEQGIEVVGASRSQEPHAVFLPYKWLPKVQQDSFRFLQLDLNHDLDRLETLMRQEKTRVVVNFSAQSMVGESWESPDDWMQTNVVAVARLAQRLRHLDFLERYVHITTPEVYGSTDGWIDEGTPFNPSTPYAVSRAAGDMIFNVYKETFQLPVVGTRAANVYGPGQPLYRIIARTIFCLLTDQTLHLHGGGVSMRSFIHMDDVSRATWQIAQKAPVGETYHISGDHMISIRSLVVRLCEMLRVSFEKNVVVVEERLGKDSTYSLSSAKLRRELSWADEISLEQGLQQTIQWVQENLEVLKTQPMHYIHKK